MRTFALICIVFSAAIALPKDNDIDSAILIFPLISAQHKGGNPSPLLSNVLPFLTNERELDDATRRMFLAAGGISSDQATRMIDEILPVMQHEGKSTYEQLMALMFVSKQFCAGQGTVCNSADESDIASMIMGSDRGCRGDHIHTSVGISKSDECVCDDQDNALLWIALLDKVQRGASTANNKNAFNEQLPNQLPVILSMILTETPCEGKLRDREILCRCSTVTEGNEGLLMQMIVSEPGAQQLLSPLAKDKITRYSREPSTRALELKDLLFIQNGMDPRYLSIFANDGASMTQKLTQYFLSQSQFDSQTVQLLLSGGFGSDPDNKVAMINFLADKGVISPDTVPFVLGVDKGSTFFLQSMIESGAMDPILGSLLLAQQTGTSQSDVFALITQLLTGATVDLTDIAKPYIPPLPEGIFPGAKLYFAHFESLGINTCALHDLRNRFECGFDGISAAQCEVLPYCCYNPIFLTDSEVSTMTSGAITTAASVPWCYYNVFFIYYNSFGLTVNRPGEFAGPSSCLPLFKYGLNIDPSVYYVYAQSSSSSALNKLVNLRTECGFPGITEFHCVAIRGCCWDKYAPFRVPQCYAANGALPTYDLNNIPVAYQPKNLTCSVNYYQFPTLYYRRIACMPTWEMFVKGRDALKVPDKYECLWQMGCCWEEDSTVGQKFPRTPRCYKREDGGYAVQANNIAQVTELFSRSGLSAPNTELPGAAEP